MKEINVTKIRILVVVLIVSFVVNTALALDGSGTEADPWRIKSLEDFNDFAADANYWAGFTRLETDVNLAGRTYTTAVIAPDINNSDLLFDGIAFTGVFDGNDHKITNLNIDDGAAGNDYLGLFGFTSDGEIKNLGLEDGSVRGCWEIGSMYYSREVGGLLGANGDWDKPGSAISNCYFTGDVNSFGYVGGLVGGNAGSISNCYFTGDVKSFVGIAGGLVGWNLGIILNCYSTGSVTGREEVGGLVSYNGGGSISNCYSTSSVIGRVGGIGGLVANSVSRLVGSNILHSSVTNCYSTGNVSGEEQVGGLVGSNWDSISNCYSTSDVNGFRFVGGLVGENGDWYWYEPGGEISNSYSTGSVNGGIYIGGLVGGNYDGGIISNCYSIGDVNGIVDDGGLVGWNYQGSISNNSFWDIDTQTHGITESIGQNDGTATNVTGLPTPQMQLRSTFTNSGWDFIDIWLINEGATYPLLRQEIRSDLNGDGGVNFLDFAIFTGHWMEGVK